MIILFFEWFYNHPALRYGGYSLIALIIFIPISLLISGYVFNLNILKKRIYFLMFLSTFIFLSKNISRISNEIDKYNYKPVKSSFFYLNKDGFKINDTVSKLYEKNFKYSDNLFFILNKRTMSE